MKIKKYIVGSMNEAISLIRRDLGKEAIIISHRKVKKPGFKGFFAPKMLEVTAAIEEKSLINYEKPKKIETRAEYKEDNNEDFSESIQALKSILRNSSINEEKNTENIKYEKKVDNNKSINKEIDNQYSELLNEVKEMKKIVGNMKVSSNAEIEKSEVYEILKDNDVMEEYIDEIENVINLNKGTGEEKEIARKAIKEMVSVSEKKVSEIMVLVGPTGVGKTTTVAKLAGRLALQENKKVGLITIDTYRIGAVEQLKTYSEIMNLPFEVVFNIKEMIESIKKLQNCDIILIDTTGRNSKNVMQLSELRAFVEKANSDCIHLVLSSSTKNKDIEAIIKGYKQLNYNNVIITKLDETNTYGSILNILKLADVPLSFITTGQSVPDDIIELNKEKIASLILKEDNIC